MPLRQKLEERRKKRLTTTWPWLFDGILKCSWVSALSDSEMNLPDQFISLLQIFLCFLQHDTVQLKGDSVPMDDLVGEVLPHKGDLSVAPCCFKEEICLHVTAWRQNHGADLVVDSSSSPCMQDNQWSPYKARLGTYCISRRYFRLHINPSELLRFTVLHNWIMQGIRRKN